MTSAILLAGLLLTATPTSAGTTGRLTLTGTLQSKSGAPVKGATVFVRTAAPRVGSSSTCPSCYVDCGKKAISDARGAFRIESLDPALFFDLLVVARGYKAQLVWRVDPLEGPQTVALAPFDLEGIEPERLVRGRLTRPGGLPAAGAVVVVKGVREGNTRRYGGDLGVDPVAVTDARGEFVLVTSRRGLEVETIVEGAGLARRPALFSATQIQLRPGVTVSGRVVAGGMPVSGVAVGLVPENRNAGTFVGTYEAETDGHGRFTLRNIPAQLAVFVYGKMDSFGARGLPAARKLTTGDDGSTLDVGDMAVAPARRLAGRLVLSDGKPLPPGTRLGLYREGPWDHSEVALTADGRFQLRGPSDESISLSAEVRGYRFSLTNPNINWRDRSIEGRLDRDIDDLVLVMEPGEPEYFGSGDKPPPGFDSNSKPGEQPLRAAPLPPSALMSVSPPAR
jgi:hypothetical protein